MVMINCGHNHACITGHYNDIIYEYMHALIVCRFYYCYIMGARVCVGWGGGGGGGGQWKV